MIMMAAQLEIAMAILLLITTLGLMVILTIVTMTNRWVSQKAMRVVETTLTLISNQKK